MKARERLLLIADRLDALAAATIFAGGCMPEDAAALRELADRWDREEKWARNIELAFQETPVTKHQAIIVQGVLARLDAPLQEDKT